MFRFITPISGICHVQLLCSLLSSLLVPHNVPADAAYEQYEMFFVFAVKFVKSSNKALRRSGLSG